MSSSPAAAAHHPWTSCFVTAFISLLSLTAIAVSIGPSAAQAWPERYGAPFTTLDGYSQVYGVVLADLNGDGHLDVGLTSTTPGTVNIRFGNGTPGLDFKLREDYTSGFSVPQGLCAADMQGDGIADLVVTDMGSNQVKVILRAGPGSPAILAQTTGAGPARVAAGDLNHDGRQDVVTANRNGNSVSVLLGNGNGTLAAKTDYATGTTPEDVALADLNGDGNLDIVTPNSGSNSVTIWLGTGTGTFSSSTTLLTGGELPISIAIARLNGDAYPDIVVGNCGVGCGGSSQPQLSVFLGTGGGTFAAPTLVPSVSVRSLVAADFNRDGAIDIAAANGGVPQYVGTDYVPPGDGLVHLGNGAGGFSGTVRFEGGGFAFDAAAGDLNHDGYIDMALASWKHDVSILLGRGDGGFGFVGEFAEDGTQPGQVVAADMTGDGKLDLVASRAGLLDVLAGNGGGIFTDVFGTTTLGTGRSSIAVADVDRDGYRDVAVARKGSSTISIFKNVAGTGFSPLQTVGALQPMAIASGDFNGDGAPDFITADSTAGPLASVFMNSGTGSIAYTRDIDVSSYLSGPLIGVAVAPLDGGTADAVVLSPSGVAVLLGDGAGGFTPVGSYGTGFNPRALTLADFNSDGLPDIAVACSDAVSILLNTGGGTFSGPTDYTLPGDHVGIAAGETNLDGWVDLVVTNKDEGTATVLLGNNDGTFVVSRNQSWGVGHGPSGIAMGNAQGPPYDVLPEIYVVEDNAVQELLNAIPYDTNAPPSVLAPDIAFVEAGGTLAFDVSAIDPDGDPMASLTCAGPSGSTFTPNGSNTAGTFSWSPTVDQVGTSTATFQASNAATGQATTSIQVRPAGTSLTGTMLWTPDNGAQGTYLVCFAASNGQGGNSTTCTSITVNPPAMIAPAPGTHGAQRALGTGFAQSSGEAATSNPVISAPATATAIAGQPLALGVSASNATSLTINTSALPALNNATFRVDREPLVTAPTQVNGLPGAILTINVSAADSDGDAITALTADLSAFPAGSNVSFTSNASQTAGTLSWTPAATDNGKTFGVTFSASNALVGSAPTVIQVGARPSAYYKLNGNLMEESGGAPLQPLSGATAAYTTGRLGLGSDFNLSASHAIGVVPAGSTFDFGPGFTAECWVMVRPPVPPMGSILMIARYSTTIFSLWPNWNFEVIGSGASTGRVRFNYENSIGSAFVESASRIDNGAFHHLAATYDGGTIRLYVDGGLQPPTTASGVSLNSIGLFQVGGGTRNTTTTTYLNGVVDEVRIWHVVRSQAEIGTWKDTELFSTITGTGVVSPVPENQLSQNRPNPFNPMTEISFTLATASHITLRIYDSKGSLVRTMVDDAIPAGPHQVRWDGMTDARSQAASGVYFYRLEGSGLSLERKMVLLR